MNYGNSYCSITKCGFYKMSKNNVNYLVYINDLNKDVHNHLCSLNI